MQIRGTLRPPMTTKSVVTQEVGQARGAENSKEKEKPGYIDKLTRLFPVEGVTLYPLAVGIADKDKSILVGLIIFIALFVGVLRYFATQPESGGSPKIPAIAVSVFAFLLYAFTLGGFGYVFGDVGRHMLLSSFITIVFTASLGVMSFEDEEEASSED
ncbi:hypothetical protein [Pontixanthobacter sp. CEM42]|uniref:hypothetical protein n=1 Tax=Pontixanthobacter sp. CEM42 TaxID=2792077 RepID=UPI001ADF878C|nr:hypothetical protein [Pontixanthobacter sp. CEM42]